MEPRPPFHIPGLHVPDNRVGDFFALAFVPGRYVSSSGRRSEPAFLSLYFSASEGLVPFHLMTISMSHQYVLTSRPGDAILNTVEYAVLNASVYERVVPSAWQLYPLRGVQDAAFPDETARVGYWTARRRLCLLLFLMRSAHGSAVHSLFQMEGESLAWDTSAPDEEEISRTVLAWVSGHEGNTDQAEASGDLPASEIEGQGGLE